MTFHRSRKNPAPKISVSTEITETTDAERILGRLYFDDTCDFCVRGIGRVRNILARRRVAVVPFEDGANAPEMRLAWYDGRKFGGADAAIFLCGRIWWTVPICAAARIPGVRNFLHSIYRKIAANRHCRNGTCSLELPPATPAEPTGTAPATTGADTRLPLIPIALGLMAGGGIAIEASRNGGSIPSTWNLPPWQLMWLLAGALWAALKLVSWRIAGGWNALGIRTFPYAAWIGMDAPAFVRRTTGRRRLPVTVALARVTAGIILLRIVAPAIDHPVIRGWFGMVAIVLILHFGLFHLAAAFWNFRGFPVRPIMDAPWRAVSLTDFWSARWNRAFADATRSTVFRPLVRRFGTSAGTMAGFAASGLTHDLVISVPAGAGYGLPTIYFLIQGAGVLAERKFGLRHSTAGRVFLWLVVLGPAFWLFHPPFMTEVIDPFLRVLEFTSP